MSVAVRINASTGAEERIEHVLGPHGLIYAWIARPLRATSAVVICSSVLGDFIANYHRERLLGSDLAGLGHAVFRFHYTGEGNSQGDRRDMTFESMCDDARTILAHVGSLGFSNVAILGTRIGALVGAAILAEYPEVPLALWEPVTDPARFMREAGRARQMSQLSQEKTGDISSWREELATQGILDVLGYDIYPAFVESLVRVDLVELLGMATRNMFIATFGGRVEVSEALAESLRKQGSAVRTGSFISPESWWLDKETVSVSADLIAATTTWLDEKLGSKGEA